MYIPEDVKWILSTLNASGFEAYAVGGCVRDTILGRSPNDWDICTSALPEETKACFPGCSILETGLKHGTVTLLRNHTPYEITTFRQDGDYLDHRRPEQVQFVRSLREDLLRRDFTIGAMAADRDGTIIDLHNGQTDLEKKLIRCVGDPHRRFQEDALRILRGLRFASQLGFSIHPDTARAMEAKKDLLRYVSGERIYAEMNKLLMGPGAAEVLALHGTVLTPIFPELAAIMGFLQHSPYHHKDVWGHTLEALSHSKPNLHVRWALLLHDIGKPRCFSLDESGIGHFYGHAKESEAMAREIFARLRADRATRDMVCSLIEHHHYDVPVTEKQARRCLMKFGPEQLSLLLEVKRCDALAHAKIPAAQARYEAVLNMAQLVEQAMAQSPCLKVKDLAITGRDLMELGLEKGPKLGEILNRLLLDVVDGSCENHLEALTDRAQLYIQNSVTARKEEP